MGADAKVTTALAESGDLCATQSHKMAVVTTGCIEDKGKASGVGSAETGGLESTEAGGLGSAEAECCQI